LNKRRTGRPIWGKGYGEQEKKSGRGEGALACGDSEGHVRAEGSGAERYPENRSKFGKLLGRKGLVGVRKKTNSGSIGGAWGCFWKRKQMGGSWVNRKSVGV